MTILKTVSSSMITDHVTLCINPFFYMVINHVTILTKHFFHAATFFSMVTDGMTTLTKTLSYGHFFFFLHGHYTCDNFYKTFASYGHLFYMVNNPVAILTNPFFHKHFYYHVTMFPTHCSFHVQVAIDNNSSKHFLILDQLSCDNFGKPFF